MPTCTSVFGPARIGQFLQTRLSTNGLNSWAGSGRRLGGGNPETAGFRAAADPCISDESRRRGRGGAVPASSDCIEFFQCSCRVNYGGGVTV